MFSFDTLTDELFRDRSINLLFGVRWCIIKIGTNITIYSSVVCSHSPHLHGRNFPNTSPPERLVSGLEGRREGELPSAGGMTQAKGLMSGWAGGGGATRHAYGEWGAGGGEGSRVLC